MSGIIALLGSGEFTDKVNDIDLYLISKIKNPKVGIIPVAAKKEHDYKKWVKRGIKHFRDLGIKAEGLDEEIEKVDDFNIYYFSGGDPGFLLESLKGSEFWNRILKNYQKGAMIIGSSAGAMVMGNKVWSKVYDFVERGIKNPWEDGLNMVNFGVMPHYDLVNKEFSKKQVEEMKKLLPKGINIKGIDENTALIKENNEWKILGVGGVYDLS